MIRAVVVVLVISATTFAQTPSIEVATVKLNQSADAIGNRFDPDRMTWTGVPLGVLIQEAYGVQPYQVSGGPIWLGSDRWDINAKTDGPTSFTQKLQLLQSLLADRFQLRFHSETGK
jgi:uncharacterized protein (TIGR03435 family)